MRNILLIILSASVIFSQTTEKVSQFNIPLTISVSIAGQFPVTGSFMAGFSERVDQFVTRIHTEALQRTLGTVNQEYLIEKIKKEFSNYSLRGITLKRADGASMIIDLQKFRINGDFNNNPYLKNDDVLIFPPYDIERNFFAIYGAVNSPGKYVFLEGDKLSDAILLAQGLNPAFELEGKARIIRLSYDGNSQQDIIVDLKSDFELKRGDQIVVLADETQRKQFFALIVGEVNQPGYIPITKNSTKLGEIIKLANGFTPEASLKRARVFRKNSINVLLERQYGIKIDPELFIDNPELIVGYEQQMMFRMSNLVEEDKDYFAAENQYRILNEGSATDFTNIFDESSEIYNFIVYPGDVIIVPPKLRSIYVFGQVKNPGLITFSEGKNFNYYIEQAGGVGEYATDDIMIIKGDSRNWITAEDDIILEDGDFIFVPKERIKSFRTFSMELAGYFSILGSIATVLLLITQLGK